MTELEKLNKWMEEEKAKGLLSIHLGGADVGLGFNWDTKLDLKTATAEEIAKEINEIWFAPTIPDPDIF